MVEQQTIYEDTLKWFQLRYKLSKSENFKYYARIACEALEKQIPKKPIIWEYKHYFSPTPNDDWGYECPCCGNEEIDYPQHHCECGQALDWMEDEHD